MENEQEINDLKKQISDIYHRLINFNMEIKTLKDSSKSGIKNYDKYIKEICKLIFGSGNLKYVGKETIDLVVYDEMNKLNKRINKMNKRINKLNKRIKELEEENIPDYQQFP